MDASAATEAAMRTEFGEIEDGFASSAYIRACEDASPPCTSIDVLEIASKGEPHANWFPELDHDALTSHLAR